MNIKEIIQQLRVTMDDAKGQDSHFDSWLTQNEGICKAIDALKILDTQPLPVQEPVACRFCHSKKGCWTWQCYHCGEIDDVQQPALPLPVQEPPQYSLKAHWTDDKRIGVVACVTRPDGGVHLMQTIIDPPPPVQEPVSMRMPKVGDKVICIEDESLGEVVSLTAGGSPDITFADGSRGTYLLHEFAELFGYVASPLPEQEPVAWDKPSASFDDWWDGDRRRDNSNPFTTDSFAYWAWEGWQAALAQRPWVGLTNEEIRDCLGPEAVRIPPGWSMLTRAIEAKLKEKNHG